MDNFELSTSEEDRESMVDLLNRQEFVDNMIKVTETLANNKKNVCYAVNGSWGVGKSFVLDMFERQIQAIQSEETATNKYMLFHYNCWSYDYYEEPLIAIVSSMLDQIEEKENFIPIELESKFKSILKIIGGGLVSKAINFVGEKTGVDFQQVVDVIENGNEDSAKELEQKYSFDKYLTFKKTLQALRKTILSLSKEKTIIFVVDELDRCLPEYAIKVLERLHHMFDGIYNLQLIISLDKLQFGHVITQIYGKDTNVDKYLAKFIDFEMKLDEGNLNDEFNIKFDYYLQNFDYINSATGNQDVKHFKDNIFAGIEIRTCIKIIDKCNLIHNMMNSTEEKKDYSFMCVEVAFAVMKYWGIDLLADKPTFNIDKVFKIGNENKYNGLDFLNNRVQKRNNGILYYNNEYDSFNRLKTYARRDDIWGVILSSYRYAVGYTNDILLPYDKYPNYGIRNYCIEYRDLLYVIS